MSDYISLMGISAIGFHGVFPEERRDGQLFMADQNDDLNATVNYADVTAIVVEEISSSPVSLIEALAERIHLRMLAAFPLINSIEITVHKPDAPVGLDFKDISVTIFRSR
jgi:dihydroneopterin aldolase